MIKVDPNKIIRLAPIMRKEVFGYAYTNSSDGNLIIKIILLAFAMLMLASCISSGRKPEEAKPKDVIVVYHVEHCNTQAPDTLYILNDRYSHYSKNGGYPTLDYVDSLGNGEQLMNYCNMVKIETYTK